jgi:hypothetical protein
VSRANLDRSLDGAPLSGLTATLCRMKAAPCPQRAASSRPRAASSRPTAASSPFVASPSVLWVDSRDLRSKPCEHDVAGWLDKAASSDQGAPPWSSTAALCALRSTMSGHKAGRWDQRDAFVELAASFSRHEVTSATFRSLAPQCGAGASSIVGRRGIMARGARKRSSGQSNPALMPGALVVQVQPAREQCTPSRRSKGRPFGA